METKRFYLGQRVQILLNGKRLAYGFFHGYVEGDPRFVWVREDDPNAEKLMYPIERIYETETL